MQGAVGAGLDEGGWQTQNLGGVGHRITTQIALDQDLPMFD
jgi:hypothetical protein